MFSLEQKIRPPLLEDPRPRDMFGLGLLVALAAILIPAWDISGQRYLNDVAGQMSSAYLLPALGFMLVLRCGAIDFSVWVSAAGGGLVAAVLIRAGVPAG